MKFSFRLVIIIIGFAISIGLIIYSVNWDLLPFQFVIANQNVTPYMLAFLWVITGIVATTLIKSGIYGKWKIN